MDEGAGSSDADRGSLLLVETVVLKKLLLEELPAMFLKYIEARSIGIIVAYLVDKMNG